MGEGRPLFAAPTGAECFSACLASTGDRAIVRYRVDERPRLTTVDLGPGAVRTRPEPGAGPFHDADADAVYDVAGGASVRPDSRTVLVAARQLEDGKMELASYTSSGTATPVELGGTSAEDWPDACRLLRGAPETNRGRPHTEIPVSLSTNTSDDPDAVTRAVVENLRTWQR